MFGLSDKMIAIALLKSIVKRPDVSEEVGHHITTAVCLLDESQREGLDEHDISMDMVRRVAMTLTGDNFMMKEPDPNDPEDVLLHKMMAMVQPGDAAPRQPSFDELLKDLFGGSSNE